MTNEELLEPFKDTKLWEFISNIINNKNFTIIKYGDFLEMMYTDNENRHNCDGSHYFIELKKKLIECYKFFLLNKNSYICKWDTELYVDKNVDPLYKDYYDFFNKFLYFNIIIHKLKKTESNGRSLIDFDNKIVTFYKTIKNSSRKKIYITNAMLAPHVKEALNVDSVVLVPFVDAWLKHEEIFMNVLKELDKDDCIVLTSCGFYAPVLVKELMGVRPNNTYIDVGSSFDGFVRGSRNFNWMPEYRELLSEYYLK